MLSILTSFSVLVIGANEFFFLCNFKYAFPFMQTNPLAGDFPKKKEKKIVCISQYAGTCKKWVNFHVVLFILQRKIFSCSSRDYIEERERYC